MATVHGSSDTGGSPDSAIIEALANSALPDFTLNTDLLHNWQAELSDVARTPELLLNAIRSEVLLSFPQTTVYFTSQSATALAECLKSLDALEDDVYLDFKLIILQLVNCAATSLYTAKIQLFRLNFAEILLQDFTSITKNASQQLPEDQIYLLTSKIQILVSLLELGCTTKQLQKLMYPLFAKTSRVGYDTKCMILSFLMSLFRLYPSHFPFLLFNNFVSRRVSIPINSESSVSKSFTICTWFKISSPQSTSAGSESRSFPLVSLADSSDNKSSTLQVELVNNKFIVTIYNTADRARQQFTFNHTLSPVNQRNQGYSHFVLSFDSYSNLNLYVDGEYSESIPCSSILKNRIKWNKIYIGQSLDQIDAHTNIFGKDELLIKDLLVLDTPCAFEWVILMYHLGLGFNWSQKEFSDANVKALIDSLLPQNLVKLRLCFKQIMDAKMSHSVSGNKLRHELTSKSFNFKSHAANQVPEKSTVVNLLVKSKFDKHNILFDSADCDFIEFIHGSKSNEILHHKPTSIYDSLYCWGGSALLLTLVEAVLKDDCISKKNREFLLLMSISLLLQCLHQDWRLNKEFESIDGYSILILLVSYYKMNFSSKITSEQPQNTATNVSALPESSKSDNLFHEKTSFLEMFIDYSTFSKDDRPESFISNALAYKILVLDFDIYHETSGVMLLQNSILNLLSISKYEEFNFKELSKMKLLKKTLQHIKLLLLEQSEHEINIKEIGSLLEIVIKFDVSVDSIKSISQFVIFSLYHESSNVKFQEIGLVSLQALTEKLCGPSSSIKQLKKFSRSISIHWILLLLSFRSDKKTLSAKIACCALALLARFLRVLGPNVISRFFHANRGTEILTYFLQSFWNNDSVAGILFLSAFGEDKLFTDAYTRTLPELAKEKTIVQSTNSLPIPEFILLLNNLALTGINHLGQKLGKVLSVPSSPIKSSLSKNTVDDEITDISFDIIHLVNQISDMIETGLADSLALQSLFERKDWLESAFEMMAHLQILQTSSSPNSLQKNFSECVERLISVLSSIFVTMLLDQNKLLTILKSLNDITSKLILNTVFPRVFKHINGFISQSNFIFKEVDFFKGVIDLIILYHNDFISQNYNVTPSDLNEYITCLIAIIESKDKTSHSLTRLGPILGQALVLKLSNIQYFPSDGEETDELAGDKFAVDIDENVKLCLYKSTLFLQTQVLSDSLLRQVIELIMGNFLKLSSAKQLQLSEHVLNFVRTAAMVRHETFDSIIEQLSDISDYQNSTVILNEFFDFLASRNDEDTLKYLQRFPTVKHIFSKNFHFRLSKLRDVGGINVSDMVQVVLNGGGSLGKMNNMQLQNFESDCKNLKLITLNAELSKANRELQDKEENTRFFSTSYNALKLEVYRLLSGSPINKSDYILDYIEVADRMRKLLVVEDQLPDSEKLTYTVEVPIKQLSIDADNGSQSNLDSAFSTFGIQDLSLSEISLSGTDLDDYEEIDENGDSVGNKKANEDQNRKVLHSLFWGDQIQSIFNISRINGLDAVESLMILGFSHIYFIENFFHCADGNVVDIEAAPKDLRDPYLQLIKPNSETNNSKNYRTRAWSLENVGCICKRKFLLRDIALEIFFDDNASLLITCLSTKQRDLLYSKIQPYASGKNMDKDLLTTLEVSSSSSQQQTNQNGSGLFLRSKIASVFSNNFISGASFQEITKKWRMGKLSNFYYLMSINTMAGRTYNDLTQYPVFPWIIADYESEELDLSKPETFRDLSKPMGAQTPKRAKEFEERYEALESMNDANTPPFHYGTHYSSAMIVASYLIRLKPYVQSYLLLQGGKFDHADRLFNSVGKAWLSASMENTTDVRELTPEFFYLPEFLSNSNNFEFGKLQNGEHSNDVKLPRWAHDDPNIFIAKNREALESPYVSANLHKWIDLIFGYKQNGKEAVDALNVFHHSSYDGAINLDHIKDDVEKRAVIGMINNFGQTPIKLFSKPHPAKEILNIPNFYFSKLDPNKKPFVVSFESKLNAPICKLEISSKTRKWIGRPACTSSEDKLLLRKPSPYHSKVECGSLLVNSTLFMNLHPTNITALLQIGNRYFLTGSEDGVIHVWKSMLQPNLSVSLHAVLRGHSTAIKTLTFSKTYHVCVSSDAEGGIILWDITRFKFIRRIPSLSSSERGKLLITVSNDSGNICTIHSTKYSNTLMVYTLNGDKITQATLKPGRITALSIASTNDSLVESLKTEFRHSFWSNELIALSYSSPQKDLLVYELVPGGAGWQFKLLQTIDMKDSIKGEISALLTFKQTEIDEEERLCRGHLLVVLGDSTGRVYVS